MCVPHVFKYTKRPEESARSLEGTVQMAVSCPMWATEPGSARRTASTLNHLPSPLPSAILFPFFIYIN